MGTTSVVDDIDGVLVDANGSASAVPSALLSYHDDSDDVRILIGFRNLRFTEFELIDITVVFIVFLYIRTKL